MSERVEVYYNLHKKCWSVRSCKTGRVIKHADSLAMRDCKFVVRPAGREKVRREGRKNVHAFVRGYIDEASKTPPTHILVTYNPYKHDTFVAPWWGDMPVKEAATVKLTAGRKVFIA